MDDATWVPAARVVGECVLGVLGPACVGIYVHGSAALGGFVEGRSDLDVLAVADGPVDPAALDVVGERLVALEVSPATGLEFSLVCLETARVPTERPAFELHVSSVHERRLVRGRDHGGDVDLPLHFAVCREHGFAVHGPGPADVFAGVPRAMVLHSMIADLEWGERSAPFEYRVLNACRAWRFATEGVLCSKVDGGEWVLGRTPGEVVVETALAVQRGWAAVAPEPISVEAFVQRAAAKIR